MAVAGPLSNVALAGGPGDGFPGVPESRPGIGPLATVAETLDMSVPQLLYALFTRYDSIAELAVARRTAQRQRWKFSPTPPPKCVSPRQIWGRG